MTSNIFTLFAASFPQHPGLLAPTIQQASLNRCRRNQAHPGCQKPSENLFYPSALAVSTSHSISSRLNTLLLPVLGLPSALNPGLVCLRLLTEIHIKQEVGPSTHTHVLMNMQAVAVATAAAHLLHISSFPRSLSPPRSAQAALGGGECEECSKPRAGVLTRPRLYAVTAGVCGQTSLCQTHWLQRPPRPAEQQLATHN